MPEAYVESIGSVASLRGVEEVRWCDSRSRLRSARSPKSNRLCLYPTYCGPKDE
jgi:hypothetical protein